MRWVLVWLGLTFGGAYAMQWTPGYPLWAIGFLALPGVAWTYLRHVTTRFKISRRRVEFERGVVGKDVDSLELWRVLDVMYKQSVWDRVLGNAKIILIGTDQTHPELVLHGLPNPRALFEHLREAVQVARHTSRPMELVGQEGMGLEEIQ
ncbi:MAG: PH domain-containing protein [bacterium]|nr:PH domain-containing protein [bacterium]